MRIHPVGLGISSSSSSFSGAPPNAAVTAARLSTPASRLRQRHNKAASTTTASTTAAAKVRSSRIRAIDFRPPRAIPTQVFVKGDSSSPSYTRDLRSSVHRQSPGARNVSMFWREKIQVVLDALQVMGVLWTSASAWPDTFRALAQFSLVLSGDALSVIEYNADEENGLPRDWNGMTSSFLALALTGWCMLPLLVTAVRQYCCRCCCGVSPQDARTKALRLEECIYLPVLLSVLHVATCRVATPLDTWAFPEDAVACWCWWDQQKGKDDASVVSMWSGWALLVVTILASLVALEFLIRVPRVLRAHANEVHIHSGAKRHERYLCSKELEYMLFINTDYEDEHFQTVASFKRHAIHQRERVLGLKVVSVLVSVVLPAVSLGDWTMSVQAGVLLFWAIVQSLAAPYRCRSTNMLHLTIAWMLTTLSGIGALRQRGTYSSLTSDLVLSPILSAIVIVSTCAALLLSVLHPCVSARERWPLARACLPNRHFASPVVGRAAMMLSPSIDGLRRNFSVSGVEFRALEQPQSRCCRMCISAYRHCTQSYRVVVGHTGNEKVDKEVRKWMTSIGEAQDLLLRCAFTQRQFLPVPELETNIDTVRVCWGQALTQRHLLNEALRDTLEDLIATCEGGRHASLLPNAYLDDMGMQRFADLVVNRERDRILLDPRMRRVLQKLVATRMWIGKRKIASLNIEDNSEAFRLVNEPRIADGESVESGFDGSEEQCLHYTVWFRGGPLHLSVVQGQRDELLVEGFNVSTSGKPGPGELCGRIKSGHTIVAVNGVDLTSMRFGSACEAFGTSSWPRKIVFRRSCDPLQVLRANEILQNYLALDHEQGVGEIGGEEGSTRGPVGEKGEPRRGMGGEDWKDMLAHHTKESMTIDDLLDAIDKLDGGHIPVDKLRMEQQLLWFIAQWEKDFNEHHGHAPQESDRDEVQRWFAALEKVQVKRTYRLAMPK